MAWLTKVTVNNIDDDGDPPEQKTFNFSKLSSLLNTLDNMYTGFLNVILIWMEVWNLREPLLLQISLTLNIWGTLEAGLKRDNTKFLKLLAVVILNPVQAHVEWKKKGRREEKNYVEEESIVGKPKMEVEEERPLQNWNVIFFYFIV